MSLYKTIFFTWLVLFTGIPTYAGDILHATVSHKDKRYFVELEAVINADSQRVFDALTNYNQLTLLSDSIKESNIVYSLSDTEHRVHIKTRACVTFFCKTINQQQDVEELPGMVVVTTSVPEKSDVEYAHARWKITPADGLTHVSFNSDLKPSFWVPPLIGPLLIETALRNEALNLVDGLERLAQQP